MDIEQINVNDIKIETARLVLRPFKQSDLKDLYEYAQVPGVGEAAGWKHHQSEEESQAVLNAFIEGHRTFAIEEKETGKVIGSVGFDKSGDVYAESGIGQNINDLGYLIAQNYWGNGYATEVIQGALSYAFYILHLDAVTCGHFSGNSKSRSVLEKCGFKFITEGKFTNASGTEFDARYYAITHTDYGVEYAADKPQAPAEESAKEEAPAEVAPVEPAPAEETAAEEAPAPVEEAPAEEPANEEPKPAE